MRCSGCGDVTVGIGDVVVRTCVDTGHSSCAFRCPACHKATAQGLNAHVLGYLTDAGVTIARWRLPMELHEPKPDGERFTPDDVLDFHFVLQSGALLSDFGVA